MGHFLCKLIISKQCDVLGTKFCYNCEDFGNGREQNICVIFLVSQYECCLMLIKRGVSKTKIPG
jgi:hypothetical protein